MRSVDIFVRIMHIGDLREFTTKNGRSGQLVTLFVKDTTGDVRTVLWDESVNLVQNVNPGDLILIQNAYTREGLSGETELHVGRLSNVTINPKELEEKGQLISQVKETFIEEKLTPEAAKEYHRVFIKDCKENQFAEVRGTILKLYERNPIYDACPECRRGLKSENNEKICPNCGKIDKSIPRLLLTGILDDGSGNIRFVVIGKEGEKILELTTEELVSSIENTEFTDAPIRQFAPQIIGKEIIAAGKIIKNEVLDTIELNISQIHVSNTLKEAKQIIKHLEE